MLLYIAYLVHFVVVELGKVELGGVGSHPERGDPEHALVAVQRAGHDVLEAESDRAGGGGAFALLRLGREEVKGLPNATFKEGGNKCNEGLLFWSPSANFSSPVMFVALKTSFEAGTEDCEGASAQSAVPPNRGHRKPGRDTSYHDREELNRRSSRLAFRLILLGRLWQVYLGLFTCV